MDAREPVIDLILLAAGASRRFGSAKLLAPLAEGTVLSAALTRAFAAPVRSVVLVVGSRAEAVAQEAQRTADAAGLSARLRIVTAQHWAEGMAASLRAGVAALACDTDAVFIGLADMPRVSAGVYAVMAEALGPQTLAVAPSYQGRRGNPALIARALFPELQALTGDQGARRLLDGLGPALALVPVNDSGVLNDIDVPEDLARLAAI